MCFPQVDRTGAEAATVSVWSAGRFCRAVEAAEVGYEVYLVEKSPAVGGAMAQLDKTFPTNDCSL